jgi:hypothetical protein
MTFKRLEIFMSVKMHVVVFWVMIRGGDVGYQCFGGVCCLHIQGEVKMQAAWPSKMVSCHITTWHHNPADHDITLME